jgi:hypothetical protein
LSGSGGRYERFTTYHGFFLEVIPRCRRIPPPRPVRDPMTGHASPQPASKGAAWLGVDPGVDAEHAPFPVRSWSGGSHRARSSRVGVRSEGRRVSPLAASIASSLGSGTVTIGAELVPKISSVQSTRADGGGTPVRDESAGKNQPAAWAPPRRRASTGWQPLSIASSRQSPDLLADCVRRRADRSRRRTSRPRGRGYSSAVKRSAWFRRERVSRASIVHEVAIGRRAPASADGAAVWRLDSALRPAASTFAVVEDQEGALSSHPIPSRVPQARWVAACWRSFCGPTPRRN